MGGKKKKPTPGKRGVIQAQIAHSMAEEEELMFGVGGLQDEFHVDEKPAKKEKKKEGGKDAGWSTSAGWGQELPEITKLDKEFNIKIVNV
jgi:hypothetical protein